MILQIQDYFKNNSQEYLKYLSEHLSLSFYSIIIASIIGITLGYLAYSKFNLKKYILSFSQGLRVIPSLAVLFILIPIIGVGRLPALIALVFLSIPPILINTSLGFLEVNSVLVETAKGMGMNRREEFFTVLLPLALPYILTGIRLSLIEVISSATLAAYIGAGGLGTLIVTGLGLYRMDLLIIGGFSVAFVSLISMIILNLLIRFSKRNI